MMGACASVFFRVITWALSVTIVVVVVFSLCVPIVLGAERFHITTKSMEPRYPPGTLVVVQPKSTDELRIGDVISFRTERDDHAVITHRIVGGGQVHSQLGQRFVTRGDNNAVNDALPVAPSEIIGVVRYGIPWIGMLSDLHQNHILKIVLPVGGCLLLLIAVFPYRKRSRRKNPEPPEQ